MVIDHNSEDTPVLVGQSGPLIGQRWMIKDTLIIGRDPTCDIPIPNRQVSRHHARISQNNDGFILEDLASKNGTHHNGKMVEDPVVLKDSDVIQIALAQQFVYLSSDATLPLESIGSLESGTKAEGRLRLEKRSRRVWIAGEEVIPPLSVSQFRLLEILYEHEGRVVSRKDIIEKVWREENALDVSEQALDALVRRLRDRLASVDPTQAYIVTVRGHGLRLENPPR